MQVIPNQSHNGKETRDCADDEAAVDQTEILHVFVLLQEHLWEKQAARSVGSSSGVPHTVSGKGLKGTIPVVNSRRFMGNSFCIRHPGN